MELWDKQKGETAKAFESFAAYRDLGPMLRTHNKVHEITGAHIRTIQEWSGKHKWVERVEAWDAYNDKKRQVENLEKVNAMNDEQFSLGKALLVKAAKALTRIPDDEIKASDIARMVEVGSKLQRISLGAANEVVEERDGGKALNPVQFYIPSNNRQDKEDEDE